MTLDFPTGPTDDDLYEDFSPPNDPQTFGTRRRRTLEAQDTFLYELSMRGTVGAACRATNLTLNQHKKWLAHDTQGYRTRVADAEQLFNDRAEDKLVELAFGLKPGQNPAPLIKLLESRMPYKYTKGIGDATEKSIEVTKTLKELAKEVRKVRELAEDIPPMDQVQRLFRQNNEKRGR